MIVAGLSELFLLWALGFAFYTNRHTHKNHLVVIALFITTFAAVMGFIRYLELADTQSLHQSLSFAAKHGAMPGFLLGLLWSTFKRAIIAYALLTIVVINIVIHSISPIPMSTDILIVGLSLYLIYELRGDRRPLYCGIIGLALLLSTLIWGAIIADKSLSIGAFHLCLGGFIACITFAAKGLAPVTATPQTTIGT